MLHLKKIDAKTIWEVVDLAVTDAQKNYVAPNDISIAQAYTAVGTEGFAFPFGIYDEDKAVGFLMIGFNSAALYRICGELPPSAMENNYSLWRLMIDAKYQNMGYGREAIKLALAFIRSWPCGKAEYCALSYVPENEVAKRLYRSFGFVENGETDDDEVVAVLKL